MSITSSDENDGRWRSGADEDGLDTPKAFIKGSYMEIRAFELAYQRGSQMLSHDIG